MTLKKWSKVKTIKTHNFGGYYELDEDEVLTPSGKPGKYFVVRKIQYAAIIPLSSSGEVYMVKQHRYSTDEITLELPTGNTDGQDPFFAARRELEEETGLVSEDWEPVGRIQEANGHAEIYGHVFIAKNVQTIENPRRDPRDENLLEVVKVSIRELKEMIADGRIDDAATVVAFTKAYFQGRFKDFE